MGTLSLPGPVKLVCGVLAASEKLMAQAEERLVSCFGAVDTHSAVVPFTFTGYYAPEMGSGLLRRWLGFERLVASDALAGIKVQTNRLEKDFSVEGKRRVNLDPGYLSLAKLVLASTKDFSHRIYLAQGIYAEVTLIYRHGAFLPLEWTYPDYRSAAATSFLHAAREAYRRQLPPL